jgi:hypothetical protein
MSGDAKPIEEERVEAVVEGGTVAKQQSVLDLAREVQEAQPKAFSFAMFRLLAVLLVGYFCIILQGFDGSLMGAINAMPQYQQFFGL